MNTQISVGLLLVIVLLLGLDGLFNDWTGAVFMGRKLSELIEWMAFWR